MADTIRARHFLHAVYDGLKGYLNVRTLPPVEQAFIKVGDVDAVEAFVKARRNKNTYVGVAVRVRKDGSLAGCGALPALFADVDFKSFPSEMAAREHLACTPIAPSIVIQSGGGLQPWWLLREPMDLQRDAATAKSLLRRLAISLGADLAAAEPARILRLPNTRNFKYTPPRQVRVEIFDPSRRYLPCDFDDWLPDEPVARVASDQTADTIPEGSRNAQLTSLAGAMRKRGAAEPTITAALLEENRARCRPPLPDEDVRRIARSVGRYAPADGAAPHAESRTPLIVHRALDLSEAQRPAEIIEGIAWEGRLTVVVAPSGDGKTFVLDAAAAVSDGLPWHGREVQHGSVLYVSFEGDAFGVRLRALRTAAGRQLDHLYVVHATDPLSPRVSRDADEQPSRGELDMIEAVQSLVADLQAHERPPLRLIIIDTVRASLGGSEDSSEHVAAYIRAARRIMGCVPSSAMLLAHHAGWQDGEAPRKRERGSSAWRGNCDATLYLEAGEYDAAKGEAPLTLRALKVRDAERPAPLHLIRRRVELAEMVDTTDVRRGPITSCVIAHDSRSREDREADEHHSRETAELGIDYQVLRLLITRPDLSTSQEGIRVALALKRDVVQAALARLIQRTWVEPPARQRQPYGVTSDGRIADEAVQSASRPQSAPVGPTSRPE